MDTFQEGETGDNPPTPPITSETMGASYGVKAIRPQRGVQEHLSEPYLMPSVHGRNGSLEKVDPAIVHTPLGGMMPGPNAIPPALPIHGVGEFPMPPERGPFGEGVVDGWPEGPPVPVK